MRHVILVALLLIAAPLAAQQWPLAARVTAFDAGVSAPVVANDNGQGRAKKPVTGNRSSLNSRVG
ncbi:hypothetical protein [Neoroseomonas lacus]|uniref:hypothetical protein n=1 Tax=Neoroseomonas lacus TaxID=287609 RepID=UPI00166956DF|nr:hypothetical protein [Neoroseomonas lacus]